MESENKSISEHYNYPVTKMDEKKELREWICLNNNPLIRILYSESNSPVQKQIDMLVVRRRNIINEYLNTHSDTTLSEIILINKQIREIIGLI